MEVEVFEHQNVFENIITNSNVYLKWIGLKLDINDGNRSFIDRLRFRRFYVFTFLWINVDFIGQMTWLIGTDFNKNSLIDVTFMIPCLTITLMGYVKSFYFLKYAHNIYIVIDLLRELKMKRIHNIKKQEYKFEKKTVNFFNSANKFITWGCILGLTTFGIGPLLITAMIFYNTGEIKLLFPFIFYYPFNAYDIRIWPFLYVQQMWSALVAVCSIWGPDYVCYAMATFMNIEFFSLKQDIICLINKSSNYELFGANDSYREKLKDIVKRHNVLLRCAKLMEATYTKTILFNVIASSILICFNVFNITTNNSVVYLASFAAFLAIVLGQIFLLCYFGDSIMRSSIGVSDAIYKCRWYGAEASVVKDLVIISLRANKPCKLTADGYSDINFMTFTKILSTSWSYFALLQTVYNNNNIETRNVE